VTAATTALLGLCAVAIGLVLNLVAQPAVAPAVGWWLAYAGAVVACRSVFALENELSQLREDLAQRGAL
jgi:hypothetical protein